jgi:hypothetical protein
MHGPPLTPREIAAVLEAQAARFVGFGMSDTAAIAAVAADNGLTVARVTAFIDAHGGGKA